MFKVIGAGGKDTKYKRLASSYLALQELLDAFRLMILSDQKI